jgi:hypothetical protein
MRRTYEFSFSMGMQMRNKSPRWRGGSLPPRMYVNDLQYVLLSPKIPFLIYLAPFWLREARIEAEHG